MAQSNDVDAIVLHDEDMEEEVGIPLSKEDGAGNKAVVDLGAATSQESVDIADWDVSVEAILMNRDQESKIPHKYEAVDEPQVKVIEDSKFFFHFYVRIYKTILILSTRLL